MYKRDFLVLFIVCIAAYFLVACQANGDFPGREYMPDMTHSKAYEPYVEGRTVMIDGDSVQLFPNNQAALKPVAGTVARGYVPYYFEDTPEGYEEAGKALVNPLNVMDEAVLEQGKVAYEVNCAICHGAKGAADGAIVKNGAYPAPPPSYFREDILVLPEGKMFHSIHYGKNLMGSYASQLTKEERWAVVAYIKNMQAEKIVKDFKVSIEDAHQIALGKKPLPAEAVESSEVEPETPINETEVFDDVDENGKVDEEDRTIPDAVGN